MKAHPPMGISRVVVVFMQGLVPMRSTRVDSIAWVLHVVVLVEVTIVTGTH